MSVEVIQETKRINQKCEQLHKTCSVCEYLNNREICDCPKYFNSDFDISKVVIMCGKYKKAKKK